MQTKLKSIKLVDGSPVVRMSLASDAQDQTQTEIELRVNLPAGSLKQWPVEEADVRTLQLVRAALMAFSSGKPLNWEG